MVEQVMRTVKANTSSHVCSMNSIALLPWWSRTGEPRVASWNSRGQVPPGAPEDAGERTSKSVGDAERIADDGVTDAIGHLGVAAQWRGQVRGARGASHTEGQSPRC